MLVRYLGTGAAEGIPALFCNCEFCKYARRENIVRTRSQVLIDGELSIDFPPDAFMHGTNGGVDLSAIKYLLVTHSHMDHFYAHDFVLRGYKYAYKLTSPALTIIGNREVEEVFHECTRRELRGDVGENISFLTLSSFSQITFGKYTVTALGARHSSKDPLVYLIEKEGKRILHLTDTGLLPEEDYACLARLKGKPCDLITLDCTFLYDEASPASRHMGLKENAVVLERLKEIGLVGENTKKVITHFSHNSAPAKERLLQAEKEFDVIAAYDGMTIEI